MSEFVLHISEGKVINRSAVAKEFRRLAAGKYLVKINAFKKRTLQQNAYYWSIVVPLVKDGLREAGYNEVKTNEDAHEVLKHLFLKRKIISEKSGEEIIIAGSTAKLKTVEFNNYLEEIWQWAATYLNIQIPQPGEQLVMYDEPVIAEYDHENKLTICK